MLATILSVDEIKANKDFGFYKFVKVNGVYRFALSNGHLCHDWMIEKGEKPEAAGMIGFGHNHFSKEGNYSSTLQVGCREEHFEEIQNLFDMRFNANSMFL